MSNTDWKGRVSKLYDQLAGSVSIVLGAEYVNALTRRAVMSPRCCRLLKIQH